MAKKVKFPLDMGNDVMVRPIEELKANYNAEKVTEYFLNGKLLTWLEDRYYDEGAEQIRKLAKQSESGSPAARLGAIFGIETEEEVDVETLEIRRRKLEKLREFTSDDEIIKNVDFVAFSQEELWDLLGEEAEVIYLCGKSFRILLSVENVSYIGVNKPFVTISGSGEIDLEAKGIVIENCVLTNGTKARLVVKESENEISYTNDDDNDFILEIENGRLCLYGYDGSDSIVDIPDNVNEIGEWAFFECESLENITIPDSVTEIGEGAFAGCSSLKNITIPDGVTEIGKFAFDKCESLENITIPDGVTEIGKRAFYECESLKNITIPDGVTEIGEDAFSCCHSLKNITIPDGVTEIGEGAFSCCRSLKNITIPDGVTEIGEGAFFGCSSLKNITIPDGVTEIGEKTFFHCSSLENITIPDSVTEIGEETFFGCSSLENITIPDSVVNVGNSAFDSFSIDLQRQIIYQGRTYDGEMLGNLLSDCGGSLKEAIAKYNRKY